jgi:rRNA maturation endonuclease Nob1
MAGMSGQHRQVKREWQCTGCDAEVRASNAPHYCPVCGCMMVRCLGHVSPHDPGDEHQPHAAKRGRRGG